MKKFQIATAVGKFNVQGIEVDADFAITQKFNGMTGIGPPCVLTHRKSGFCFSTELHFTIETAKQAAAWLRQHGVDTKSEMPTMPNAIRNERKRAEFRAIAQP